MKIGHCVPVGTLFDCSKPSHTHTHLGALGGDPTLSASTPDEPSTSPHLPSPALLASPSLPRPPHQTDIASATSNKECSTASPGPAQGQPDPASSERPIAEGS